MKQILPFILCAGAGFLSANSLRADVVGQLWQNQPVIGANATLANKPATPADAWFNTSAIDFNSSITGYALHDFLQNPTFYNTSATFDPNLTVNNTYFYFAGQTFLHAGVNSFVVPHDDGLQLYFPGIGMVVDQPLPTAPVNTPFDVVAPADGVYAFELSYGEVFGAPAVLGFKINGQTVTGVPDSASTLMLLSAGLGLLGTVKRYFKA